MMNTDGTTGGNNMSLGQADDQQMITSNDRETYIARLTNHFNGDRELAKQYDDEAFMRSGGKAIVYKKVLHMLLQQRTQQIQQIQQQQQQQQQQQSMMASQQQQQSMYMQSQQTSMVGMPQQQQPPPSTYIMQAPLSSSIAPPTASMMNIKQEPQPPMPNVQMRLNPQNFPMQQQQLQQQQQQHQQQQQIKQELMVPPIPQQQQQIKQELMIPPVPQQQQQQPPPPPGVPVQQMRQQQQQPMQYNQQQQQQQQQQMQYNQQQQQQQQQTIQYNQQQQQQQQPPPSIPNQSTTTTPQQRNIAQQLQQVRQQSYLNQQQQQQQQQQESSNSLQMQQQQQQQPSSNPSTLPPSASMNGTGPSSSAPTPTTSAGSSDEILQQLLTSPNPPKQPSTVGQNVAQARLRTLNRTVRNQAPQTLQQQQQQQQQHPSPMTPGSDPMMGGNVPSPHSHPGMMQQPQTPIGPPGQSPLARYMMAQSPQPGVYRPQMSPMNMMNYASSPTTMIDDEMHYLFKYFTDRIHYLTRIITRCQQEGQHDKVAKYRQLHDQMAAFVRNPIPEHLMGARRLKEHVDRILDPRMFGPIMMSPMVEMTGMIPPNNPNVNNNRLMTNGIFEQCQRAIVDYLGKDTTLKYNVAKRFLEPLSEVLNGVPYKNMRLDSESKQIIEPYSSQSNTQSLTSLVNIIENEFSHLSMNTFTYELKPLSDKMSSTTTKIDLKDLTIQDYELTCRFIEINMPVVPPLKIKLTVKYPHEPPEILSLTSTTLNLTPTKLEYSDGHSFFESISRNFLYFLFKLPAQHTITDILDIWRTAIRNASSTQQEI